MKIDPTGPLRTAEIRRGQKAERRKPGAFAAHIGDSESGAESAPSGAAAATSGVSGLLALQEVDGDVTDDSRASAWGNDILDYLDKLRHDLLVGAIQKDELRQLAAVVREKRGNVTDPKLAGILDEIELRAEVELAKYTV